MPGKTCACLAILCLLTSHASAAVINGFGDFSQFTYNQNPADIGSPPTVSPGTITITDGGGGEGRSLFYNAPVNITSFTASFTYQIPPGGATVFDFDPSAAFVIQNSPQGVMRSAGAESLSPIPASPIARLSRCN